MVGEMSEAKYASLILYRSDWNIDYKQRRIPLHADNLLRLYRRKLYRPSSTYLDSVSTIASES
jgi:hypothetical protein